MAADKKQVTPMVAEARWREFAELIITGTRQIDAYKKVYGAGNMTNQSLAEKASHLKKSPKVQEILRELQKKNADASDWKREDTIETLLKMLNEAKEASKIPTRDKDGNVTGYKYNAAAATVAVKCSEAIAKMCGYNEPEKVDNRIQIVIEGDLDEYSK